MQQCEMRRTLRMGISIEATVAPPKGPGCGVAAEADALTVVSPGQQLTVLVKFHNASKYPLRIERLVLEHPDGRSADNWLVGTYKGDNDNFVKPGEDFYANFRFEEFRRMPRRQSLIGIATIPKQKASTRLTMRTFATLPFPPSPLRVHADYRITGRADLCDSGIQVKGNRGRRAGPLPRQSRCHSRMEQKTVRKRYAVP